MPNPSVRRSVIRSPGTNTCASGSTISATLAIDTPAKPEVTNCCPQASSMNGTVELRKPMLNRLSH